MVEPTSSRTIDWVADAGGNATFGIARSGPDPLWVASMRPPVTSAATAPTPTRLVAHAVRRPAGRVRVVAPWPGTPPVAHCPISDGWRQAR